MPGRLFTNSDSNDVAPCISDGSICSISGGIYGANFCARLDIPVTILGSVSAIRGTRLSATAITESTRLLISTPMSCDGSAIPVSRFVHADFIMPMEPCIVVAASFAVVPIAARASSCVMVPFFTASAACSAVSPDIPIST